MTTANISTISHFSERIYQFMLSSDYLSFTTRLLSTFACLGTDPCCDAFILEFRVVREQFESVNLFMTRFCSEYACADFDLFWSTSCDGYHYTYRVTFNFAS